MTDVFGHEYAALYDAMYADKDYRSECDLVLEAVDRHLGRRPTSMLDLGCGTGSHALQWATEGIHVVGIDASPHMIALATSKAAARYNASGISFLQGDVRSFQLGRTFDAVAMMFAVLGYQSTDDDLVATLSNVRRHLSLGGTFVADVWFGPAAVTQRPERRFSVLKNGEGTILKSSSADIDILRQLCTVHMDLWWLIGGQLETRVEETHNMRFFFESELRFMLAKCGLELRELVSWPKIERPGLDTWSVLLVAAAV